MPIDKRKVQEINAGSMADIAFLLLIFFLVATTMNVDTGIARNLPPMPPEDQKVEDMKVKIRNLLPVLVNAAAYLRGQGRRTGVRRYPPVEGPGEGLPPQCDGRSQPARKEVEEFELPDGSKWSYPVGKGVLSLQTTKDTQYQIYIMVQNELTRAINEIRDEVSKNKFQMKFSDLGEAERGIVAKAVPMSISEAEPRDLGGKSSMAVIKKKGNKSLPPISTASLPDVIFMILFFFMVSTTMRDQELHVKYQVPEATEVQKLEKKSLVSYIHIGEPIGVWREQYGPAPRIQLNDAFKTAQDIGQFVAAERDKLNESERALMTICLKADRYTTMGRITEIKQELRRANALKISYAAAKTLGY